MSGQIIHFQARRRQSMAQGLAAAPRSGRRIEQQIARIADLVDELEGLTRSSRDVPPGVIAKARVTMDKARRLVVGLGLDEEGDPQPEVDRSVLERLYRGFTPAP